MEAIGSSAILYFSLPEIPSRARSRFCEWAAKLFSQFTELCSYGRAHISLALHVGAITSFLLHFYRPEITVSSNVYLLLQPLEFPLGREENRSITVSKWMRPTYSENFETRLYPTSSMHHLGCSSAEWAGERGSNGVFELQKGYGSVFELGSEKRRFIVVNY